MNQASSLMSASKPGLLLAIIIIAGLHACISVPIRSTPAVSTSIVTQTDPALPTATRQRPTFQWPTLIPSPTTVVPRVPDDKRIIVKIDVGDAPWHMTVANGYLWVLAGNSVVRIDPQADQVVGKPIPISVPAHARLEDIAVGEDDLWVSIVGGGNIGVPNEIDSKTNELTGEPFRTGAAPYSITVGDGSVWVVNHDDGTLTRIDPETNQIIADIPSSWEPHRVAFGEGAVWLGNWHDSSVSRIDPRTNQIVDKPIPIGYVAGNIAAGYGNVWVTSDYRGMDAILEAFPDHVVLVRIDPKTNKVVDTIPLGGHPVDVEVTEDAVWVSIQNPDFVLKIQP